LDPALREYASLPMALDALPFQPYATCKCLQDASHQRQPVARALIEHKSVHRELALKHRVGQQYERSLEAEVERACFALPSRFIGKLGDPRVTVCTQPRAMGCQLLHAHAWSKTARCSHCGDHTLVP